MDGDRYEGRMSGEGANVLSSCRQPCRRNASSITLRPSSGHVIYTQLMTSRSAQQNSSDSRRPQQQLDGDSWKWPMSNSNSKR